MLVDVKNLKYYYLLITIVGLRCSRQSKKAKNSGDYTYLTQS